MGRVLWLSLTLLLAFAPAPAQALVADLSDYTVEVHSGFTGKEILVFGSLAGDDGASAPRDVVIVVRGPARSVTVRKKARTAGIWVNRHRVRFHDIPGFYAVLSNKPLAKIASSTVLARNAIGTESIAAASEDNPPETQVTEFREALFRSLSQEGLYSVNPAGVSLRGADLFRSNLALPAVVPEGIYRVDVFAFEDGRVISAQSSSFSIDKVGFERIVYRLATQHAFFYGLCALLLAVAMGWGASWAFRKG